MTVVDAHTLVRSDLSSRVYANLRERLATREFAPGEQLSLQGLATSYGVSRSPVWHALTRLASDGLIEVRPQLGHFVKPLTRGVLDEAYDVREALELYAAEQTVGRLEPEQLARLRGLVERTLEHLDGRRLSDRRGYIATNQAFHDYQVGLAGNSLLLESYQRLSVNALMARVLSTDLDLPSDVASEHSALVAGFEAGDFDVVRAAIRAHVQTGKQLAVAAIDEAGGVL
jgi:DNA-binding GntR family transcriptional regulator